MTGLRASVAVFFLAVCGATTAQAACVVTFDLENPRPWGISVNQVVEVETASGGAGFAKLERVEFFEVIPAGVFFQDMITVEGSCRERRRYHFLVYCTLPGTNETGENRFRRVTYPRSEAWTSEDWIKADLGVECPFS